MHGIPDIFLYVKGGQIDITIEIMTLLVMSFLFIIAFVFTPKFEKIPKSKIQNIFEMIVEFLNNLAVDMIGPKGKTYVPLAGTIFLFVLISNWMGLIPGNLFSWVLKLKPAVDSNFSLFGIPLEINWQGLLIQPPTGNINTPLALALASVIYYNYSGIRSTGLKKYLLHHIGPVPELAKNFGFWMNLFLLPPLTILFIIINIMEHISRTFSLTVRLFCNIMGEHSVLAALVAVMLEILKVKGLSLMALPILIPLPLIVMALGIITGAIQALIFTLLTLSYISSVVSEHH